MRNSGPAAVVFLVSLALPAGFSAQERISPSEAAKYVGKSATACGKVASTAYAIQVVGRPTFLNLERPYPNQPFTVVIWGSEQSRVSLPPEKAYDGKTIYVSGIVRVFRDEPPRIVVSTPSQITIE